MDTNVALVLIALIAVVAFLVQQAIELTSNSQKIQKGYTVWVGGVEVNDNYFTREEDARCLAQQYIDDGYDDVQIEMVRFPVD